MGVGGVGRVIRHDADVPVGLKHADPHVRQVLQAGFTHGFNTSVFGTLFRRAARSRSWPLCTRSTGLAFQDLVYRGAARADERQFGRGLPGEFFVACGPSDSLP
jgi:hypothetical protein